MLNAWRHGVPAVATVVDSKQSAIAPRSRVVRYTLAEGADRRIFSTLFPASQGELQKDDELLVLIPPKHPDRAVIAELYLENHKSQKTNHKEISKDKTQITNNE